ncbi:hypothetical protein BJX99DRAFT_237140 [Aspergillus californicus]
MSTPELPSTEAEWQSLAIAHNVSTTSIHKVKMLESASPLTEQQLLLLQVLFSKGDTTNFPWERFDLDRWQDEAKTLLDGYSSWHTFCDSLGPDKMDGPIGESIFAIAQFHMRSAAKLSDETISSTVVVCPSLDTGRDIINQLYQQTHDECTVNSALFYFLVSLTVQFNLANRWTMHQLLLQAEFNSGSFYVRTDGHLDDKATGEVVALVDVKTVVRSQSPKAIRSHEAAQMVAWLKNMPDRQGLLNQPGRRLHVSQNRHEIFLIFSEYGDDYMDFLENDNIDPTIEDSRAFLTMVEYGPWDTRSADDMKDLAVILVAIALRADEDFKNERRG